MSEVIDILASLREDHARITDATTMLAKASIKFDGWLDPTTGELVKGVRQRYEEVYDDALVDLEERCLADGVRMPPGDLREARVKKQIRRDQPNLMDEHWSLEGTIKNLQRTIAGRKVAIGAAQSVIKGERE